MEGKKKEKDPRENINQQCAKMFDDVDRSLITVSIHWPQLLVSVMSSFTARYNNNNNNNHNNSSCRRKSRKIVVGEAMPLIRAFHASSLFDFFQSSGKLTYRVQ